MSATASELEWELTAVELIASMRQPLEQIQAAFDDSARSFRDTACALDDATAAGLQWIRANPCRDTELDARVGRLFAAQSLALESVGVAFRRPRPTDEQLDAAGACTTESMHAVAESLDWLRRRLPIA